MNSSALVTGTAFCQTESLNSMAASPVMVKSNCVASAFALVKSNTGSISSLHTSGKRRLVDLSVAARIRTVDSSLTDERQLVAYWSTTRLWKPTRNKTWCLCCIRDFAQSLNYYMRPGFSQFPNSPPFTIGGKVDRPQRPSGNGYATRLSFL